MMSLIERKHYLSTSHIIQIWALILGQLREGAGAHMRPLEYSACKSVKREEKEGVQNDRG